MNSLEPQQQYQQQSINPPGNVYLDQVLRQQAQIDRELKPKKMMSAGPAPARARRAGGPAEGDSASGGRAVDYRITGFLWWKTVVVPPNVYVVHTRRGHKEPVNIGQGISFRFDPTTDAFLVIPAAMQTIIINANCISAERQGVLVQAYVQWVIDDIAIAYRKLDFSDPEDPMRVVNVQLREQAEAAIKDKVATMPIDEILSDKQPIIEELTLRLRAVAEGSRREPSGSGLGLKIVTVQIKEAVVSSMRLWENLQKPFRAERQMMARMAELQAERSISSRELEIRKAQETAQMETESELAQLRAQKTRETYDREQAERLRRHKLEQEAEQRTIAESNATERARREAALELTLKEMELEAKRLQSEMERVRLQIEAERVQAERVRAQQVAALEVQELQAQARSVIEERDTIRARERRAVENELSEQHLRSQLIEKLPEVARALPAPHELRTLSIGSDGAAAQSAALTGFLTSLMALVDRKATQP